MERVVILVGGVGLVWWLLTLLAWQGRRREPTAWDVLTHRPGTDPHTGRPLDRGAADASSLSPGMSWGTGDDAGCSGDAGSCDW